MWNREVYDEWKELQRIVPYRILILCFNLVVRVEWCKFIIITVIFILTVDFNYYFIYYKLIIQDHLKKHKFLFLLLLYNILCYIIQF